MILKAAWVVPVVSPPIRGGYVHVSGTRITAVGPLSELPADVGDIEDFGDVVLTPGLVNPHTHLELSGYAGKLPPAPFWPWIADLMVLRRQPGRVERERAGVREGAWQSLRAGVTCVGDISRENVAWDVLKAIPIRKVCFAELLTLADLPPADPAQLRAAVADIVEDDLLTAGVTPHAPYTVPQDQLQTAIALADELGRPWCTHWAETREEVAFLANGPEALPAFLHGLLEQCNVRSPHLAPVEYLERCAGGSRPGTLAHGNYLSDDDIRRLADTGHTVVYCPRAHRFFGHSPHPFRRLMAAGVRVAIGTDSSAGNENLSLLEELQYVSRELPDPPSPTVLLRMATLDAARALELDAQIGSLETGKQADLAAFPCPPQTDDPVATLVDTAPTPSAVWVAGRRVV